MKTQEIIEKPLIQTNQPDGYYLQICNCAKELEDSGEYESAAEALGELWAGLGERPDLEGLADVVKAEILIRIGSISGWLGSARQVEGSQEKAKDLISEGIRILEESNDAQKIAESQSDLGVCYWREGFFPEAEVYQTDALAKVPKRNYALRGKILLRLVNVAISTAKYDTAAALLKEAAPMIEKSGDNLLLGKLYFHQALVFNFLFEADEDKENSEKTIEYYQKASRHYAMTKHRLYQAVVENNLGAHLLNVRKFRPAHQHLDIAIKLFSRFENAGRLAGAYDSKARVYLEQAKLIEAEVFAQKAVQLLSAGGEFAQMSEALTTLGTILARQESYEKAADAFDQALEKALYVDDAEDAGVAMLARLDALYPVLSDAERFELLLKTKKYLGQTESRGIKKRLAAAESKCTNPDAVNEWNNFSLSEEVLKFEAAYITKALEQTGGKVTKAAELLGVTHQNLSLMLKKRHHRLASIKKPRRVRSDRKVVKKTSKKK